MKCCYVYTHIVTQATMQKKLMITQADILQATKELQPSLSPKDRSHFLRL